MRTSFLRPLGLVFVLLCFLSLPGLAGQAVPAAAADDRPGAAASAAHDDFNDPPDSTELHNRLDRRGGRNWRNHDDGDIVNIGHGSHLPAGQRAESVVSILGSSVSEGEAQNVVSVIGDTRILGPVGESAVAVMGSAYVDDKVDGDVVAVLGNVELGPHAEIGGDVVAVMGGVERDPAAIVHGSVQRIINWD